LEGEFSNSSEVTWQFIPGTPQNENQYFDWAHMWCKRQKVKPPYLKIKDLKIKLNSGNVFPV